jgi:hypothetical protein
LTAPVFAEYSGGSGTEADPWQIACPNDLLYLGSHPADYSSHFILTADINLAGYIFTTAVIAPDTNNVSSGFQGTAFTGTFDGSSFVIRNLTIDINGAGNDYLGLFGSTGYGSQIRKLGIEDVNITGGNGSYYVGGLVGKNYCGSISNCYSTGAVSGVWLVGGLAGVNAGSISNCHSTGAVSGSECVGGLVGENYYISYISNCYSTGAVSGSSYVGGLVGYTYGSVISSFWDTQTSGWMISAGGTGKTTAQMKTLSTFTLLGWDFVEIWGIGENQTYPYLRTEPAGDLNHDKKVDFEDFTIFALHWLEGTGP